MNQAGGPLARKPVDLLFDARHIQQSGIGTYIRTVLPHVERTMAQRRLSLAVLADPDTAPPVSEITAVVLSRPRDAPMYSMAEQKAWRYGLRITHPRAIWLPHYPFPFAMFERRNKEVLTFVTVHDTLHLEDRQISGQGWARKMYARTMLTLDARNCRRIFTPSQATATSLVAAVPSARVLVTPIPVDDVWFTQADRRLCPARPRFILYVGNTKRHKNVPLLIDAFTEIADTIPHNLVIAGGGQFLRSHDERVGALAARHADRIHVLGRLGFEELRSLVACADLLVLPSLYEGAGLPPLEAMASGTAVLCSALPVLRETCGDGADYFDPFDRAALASLLRTYCRDDEARSALAARGRSHVTKRQSQISISGAAEAVAAELGSS